MDAGEGGGAGSIDGSVRGVQGRGAGDGRGQGAGKWPSHQAGAVFSGADADHHDRSKNPRSYRGVWVPSEGLGSGADSAWFHSRGR